MRNVEAGNRVLVIGMGDSVHLGRWLQQFVGSEFIFHIVSSSPHRRLDRKISELLVLGDQFEMSFVSKFFSLPLWLLDRLFGDRLRGILIARAARKFRPNIIHVLEFQNAGYSYLRAREYFSGLKKIPVLLTPYGSDMFWFQRYKHHRLRLEKLVRLADALSSECGRDEILATNLGFHGKMMERVPAFGAIHFPANLHDAKDRSVIAIKGYQNKWGRASNALRALALISGQLTGYQIVLFSCNRSTLRLARRFARGTSLPVTAHKKGSLSHELVQEILSRAAIYIGLSRSDGISASMIEAMANGAIPIQSNTSCCDEWLLENKGGFLVDYDDIRGISKIILKTIKDVDFRQNAAKANQEHLLGRLSPEKARQISLSTYRTLIP